jgi:hypothetical protein
VYLNIVRWWFLCALHVDCIAPTNDLYCKFATGPNRYAYYANCHRYDQSALNVLLVNHFVKQLSSNDSQLVDRSLPITKQYMGAGALEVLRGQLQNHQLHACADDGTLRSSPRIVSGDVYFPRGIWRIFGY